MVRKYHLMFEDVDGNHGIVGAEILLDSYEAEEMKDTYTWDEIERDFLTPLIEERKQIIFQPYNICGLYQDHKRLDLQCRHKGPGLVVFYIKVLNARTFINTSGNSKVEVLRMPSPRELFERLKKHYSGVFDLADSDSVDQFFITHRTLCDNVSIDGKGWSQVAWDAANRCLHSYKEEHPKSVVKTIKGTLSFSLAEKKRTATRVELVVEYEDGREEDLVPAMHHVFQKWSEQFRDEEGNGSRKT